ncbi:adenylyltransferase/cytidyltransferase family protein [Candidatus Woesearchaeota archaeon]|nr:adenylyltransferase/cytidyltransferase family protein [Candidatus Woesearchaeota archaeon]
MKRVVWANKSNGQLCVTIPKEVDVKEGDFVEIKKAPLQRISYLGIVGDLFHYGHLSSIKFANSLADYMVCGVLTDKAVESYRVRPIANITERKAVIENLNCVDRVMTQDLVDPTENLKRLHEEFPHAEIILVHGDNWQDVPGIEYIKSIGGKIVQHPYYGRLSTFKIVNQILQDKDKYKDITKFTSFIRNGSSSSAQWDSNKAVISSKADTLAALKPLLQKSKIEDLYTFTISDWKNDKKKILRTIQELFTGKIVIRSSAVSEDTLEQSLAGNFQSVLHIDSQEIKAVEEAIATVLRSYREKQAESSFNQILVQKQTDNITMSGVLFTRTLEKNAPYYVVNYDDKTGSSDSVTAGRENQVMIIAHDAENIPEKMKPLLEAVQELEQKIPSLPLDIEFAISCEGVVIFQVRPLAVNRHKERHDEEVKERVTSLQEKFLKLTQKPAHLCGETTIFADMPDWNPAEIIGDRPNLLDYSLYDYVITNSAWHEARASQGYHDVKPAKLVELFANKPYVNVRNSFNSFIPAAIKNPLRDKLVAFYLDKLRHNQHLQDKVEFEIAYTCYDLSFDERSLELEKAGFTKEELRSLKQSLLQLTNTLVSNYQKNIDLDIKDVLSLGELRTFLNQKVKNEKFTPKELINNAKSLLDECRRKGTVQFSRLARLGFIGKIILKSMVKKGIIFQDTYDRFYKSLNTVASEISNDFKKLLRHEISEETFIKKYYHLRPGTYDITSLRYDKNPTLFQVFPQAFDEETGYGSFIFDTEKEKIKNAFQEHGLQFSPDEFFEFTQKATEARELSKFEFTKNLSDALELLAEAGELMGFTRKEMALLDINEIFRSNALSDVEEMTQEWKSIIKIREEEKTIHDKIVLPSLLFSEDHFDLIQHYEAKPNFITQKIITRKVVNINSFDKEKIPPIEGSIVILENGDPGYDWIFTRNPAGLITKYGGVASHMSIRCAEFGIPAAIGCGEMIFERVKNATEVRLDCKANKIEPLRR